MLDSSRCRNWASASGSGRGQIAGLLAAALPICLLAPAIQTYASTFARSFKEAQSYMGMLVLLPMVPGMLNTLYPLSDMPWLQPVPIIGQQVLLTQVLGGRPVALVAFTASAATTVLVALVLLRMTTRLFERERIIFSR